jgi:hypothetical protein
VPLSEAPAAGAMADSGVAVSRTGVAVEVDVAVGVGVVNGVGVATGDTAVARTLPASGPGVASTDPAPVVVVACRGPASIGAPPTLTALGVVQERTDMAATKTSSQSSTRPQPTFGDTRPLAEPIFNRIASALAVALEPSFNVSQDLFLARLVEHLVIVAFVLDAFNVGKGHILEESPAGLWRAEPVGAAMDDKAG